MRILSFEFEDKKSGWKLEETRFDMFNLVVGASGVGKTKILKALEEVCRIATEGDYRFGEISWSVAFEQGGQRYKWEGETGVPANSPLQLGGESNSSAEIVNERLESNALVFDRTPDRFLFGPKDSLPKLKRSDSAIVLLAEEASVAPVADGFRRLLFSRAASVDRSVIDTAKFGANIALMKRLAASTPDFHVYFELLVQRGLLGHLTKLTSLMAYMIQEFFPAEFRTLASQFASIFTSVVETKVLVTPSGEHTFLDIAISEEGSTDWIGQSEMSSGMLRTFAHLVELHTTPKGSVIVIDEFENSLGVNCMSEVVDLVSRRAGEIQYILTSHHPYIINNIPVKDWKLVKRHHNKVRVISARDIPALNGASHHDAFTKLINLPAYEEGIS